MFKLHIRWSDVTGSWRRQADRWISGSSWIEPYSHPLLAVASEVLDGNAFRLDVSERSDTEGDRMSITIGDNRVQVQAGHYGTAPLYLVPGRGVIDGSWLLADLVKVVDPRRLNSRAIARTLTREWRYGLETVFEDAIRVTAGATVVLFANGRHSVAWPEPVERVTSPRRLSWEVDWDSDRRISTMRRTWHTDEPQADIIERRVNTPEGLTTLALKHGWTIPKAVMPAGYFIASQPVSSSRAS